MKNNMHLFLLCTLLFAVSQAPIGCMEQVSQSGAEKVEQIQLLQLAEARIGQAKKYLSERWLGTKAQEHARAAVAYVSAIKKTIKDSSLIKNYQEAIHRLIDHIAERVSLAEAAAENQEAGVSVTETATVENGAAVEVKVQELSQEIRALKVRMTDIRHLTTSRWQGRVAQEYTTKAYENLHRAESIVDGRPLAVNYDQFATIYIRRVAEYIHLAKVSEERELPDMLRAEAELRRRQEKRERRREAAQCGEGAYRQENTQSRQESQQQEKPQEGERFFVGRDSMSIEQAYRVLGIAREDQHNSSAIKKAYHTLALTYHPDKAVNAQDSGDQESEKQQATARMQQINAAYKALKEYLNF